MLKLKRNVIKCIHLRMITRKALTLFINVLLRTRRAIIAPFCFSMEHKACSQRIESRSESRFGSRSASWLGSWFELRAFTCIANAFPITIRICALRGNILFLLRSPRWLTHAWLQRAFPKGARTNHVPKELCIHTSSESGFLRGSRSKTPFLSCFKSLIWKSFASTKGKIWLSIQERVRITFRNGFRNVIHSFVNRPTVEQNNSGYNIGACSLKSWALVYRPCEPESSLVNRALKLQILVLNYGATVLCKHVLLGDWPFMKILVKTIVRFIVEWNFWQHEWLMKRHS